MSKMTSADYFYVLFKMRILSYDSLVTFAAKCPECGGKFDVRNYDISTLEVHELEADYKDNMFVKLPHNGATVYTKLLSMEEEDEITKETNRLRKKFPDADSDPGVTIDLARRIERIELTDGNIITEQIDIVAFVEKLISKDAAAIRSTWEDIQMGIDPTIEYQCPHCKEQVPLTIQFGGGFFRPKFSRSKS